MIAASPPDSQSASVGSVLDASAIIAYAAQEPGWENVRSLLGISVVNTVNWAEVVQEVLTWTNQIPIDQLKRRLETLGLRIVDFSVEDAEGAGRLIGEISVPNISLADRCCLATAKNRQLWAVSADTPWAGVDVGVNIYIVRVPAPP